MSEESLSNKRAKSKKVKIKFRHKHPIVFRLFGVCLVSGLLVACVSLYYIKTVINKAPVITEAELRADVSTSNMYADNGTLIWSATENRRDYVDIEDVPELYINLLLSTEEKEYYTSPGFSYKGMINAAISLIKARGNTDNARGGSTIEQQLIKNLAFSSNSKDRTINRKIQELWLSQQLDANFSKSQILEWYINKIWMGENAYGAQTALMNYYGLNMKDLKDKDDPATISKLATIAGLGQAPAAYNLYDDPDLTQRRRDIVLKSAYNNGKITKSQYTEAKKIDVKTDLKERYWRNNEVLSMTKAHNAYVTSTLAQLDELGYDLAKTPMQIYTSLNLDNDTWLQSEANKSDYYQGDNQQIAITVMDSQSGYILGQVGARGSSDVLGLNRATSRNRSSGSIIKPFEVFAPAVEYANVGTDYILDSSPYTYPGTNITATNWGGYSYGNVTLRKTAEMSLNTPSTRLLDEKIGSDNAKEFLSKLHMDVKDSYGGSDALGLNVSTQDIAAGFSALANEGKYMMPSYIKTITFPDGSTKDFTPTKSTAMKPSTAYIVLDMLKGVTTSSNGTAQAANIPQYKGYATKTGTVGYVIDDDIVRPSNAVSDMWIGGTTKSISTAIWTGYDEPNTADGYLIEDEKYQQQLYKAIMLHYNEGRDTSDWKKPDSVLINGKELSPASVDTDSTTKPIVSDSDASIDKLIKLPDSFTVKSPEKKSYTLNSWINSLSADNKALYEKYKAGQLESKDIDSILKDNGVFTK